MSTALDNPRPPALAVVILNWNASGDTLGCLAHVAQWRSVRPRVWIVDNASTAEDRQSLRHGIAQLSLDCSVIENSSNLGFAGGTNVGLSAALSANPDADDAPILLLNNDARIEDADLQQLMATFAAHPRIGWLGPPLYHDGKLHSVGRRNPVLHHNSLITTLPHTPLLEVDFISGSIALVRADLLRKIGLMDEDYFFNTEVADHCHRARDAGYTTVVDCQARGHHNLDRSSSLRSTLYVYYIIRNRFVYAAKRYRLAAPPLTLLWSGYCLLLAAKLWATGQRPTAKAVYLGMVDGVSKRWGGQNSRVLAACGQSRLDTGTPAAATAVVSGAKRGPSQTSP